jgi:hypothetical protein
VVNARRRRRVFLAALGPLRRRARPIRFQSLVLRRENLHVHLRGVVHHGLRMMTVLVGADFGVVFEREADVVESFEKV